MIAPPKVRRTTKKMQSRGRSARQSQRRRMKQAMKKNGRVVMKLNLVKATMMMLCKNLLKP